MNLILQALHDIPSTQVEHLAKLSNSARIERIAAQLYRLSDARMHDGIAAYCYEHRIDYGFVPRDTHLSDFGLVVMDMDSTLISIECID
jgi:phosphoserine phosphatase